MAADDAYCTSSPNRDIRPRIRHVKLSPGLQDAYDTMFQVAATLSPAVACIKYSVGLGRFWVSGLGYWARMMRSCLRRQVQVCFLRLHSCVPDSNPVDLCGFQRSSITITRLFNCPSHYPIIPYPSQSALEDVDVHSSFSCSSHRNPGPWPSNSHSPVCPTLTLPWRTSCNPPSLQR